MGSLHSRFDAAKEVVNAELAIFAGDALDETDVEGSVEGEREVEGILEVDLLGALTLMMHGACGAVPPPKLWPSPNKSSFPNTLSVH